MIEKQFELEEVCDEIKDDYYVIFIDIQDATLYNNQSNYRTLEYRSI